MSYVITNGTEYIMKNRSGKYVTIRNAAMADEFAKPLAEKVLHNQLPKKVRSGMYLEKVDNGKTKELPEIDTSARVVSLEISEDVQKWINKLQGLNGLATEADKRKKELVSMLSDVDKRICDLAHYVEFCTLNACQGYKAAKKWHDLRCERREIKNELEVVSFILNKKITDSVSEEAVKLVDNINKRQYEPRVLKELFDV